MSKELEALECLDNLFSNLAHNTYSENYALSDYKKVKQALTELKAIKEAKPSEAMECWKWIDATIPVWVREKDKEHPNVLEPIKQALLKAQEPKKYLKWEDLEFKEEEQTMKVILNGKEYILKYEKLKDYDVDRVRIIDEYCYKYMMLHTSTKQFFNDLHLERVEE